MDLPVLAVPRRHREWCVTTEQALDTTGTLTAKEQALFELLARNRGRLFTRMEILERVWGLDFGGDERIVDAYVKRVRRKVSEDAIETVRGAGYRRPAVPDQRQSLPHFGHLSTDARTILNLGRRVLHVSTVSGVLLEVESVLNETMKLSGVALLARSGDRWEVHSSCGDDRLPWESLPPHESHHPVYPQVWGLPARTVALLPLVGNDEAWGTLAVASAPGEAWTAGVYAQLEAVAALVNPALRLSREMSLRQLAERELRDLNARLEYGVQQRTHHLLLAKQQAETLNALFRQMERARSVPELLSLGLPVLAKLAGAPQCSAWFAGADAPLASYRADGSYCSAPPLPGEQVDAAAGVGVVVRSEVNGETLVIHASSAPGQPLHLREVNPLLETATHSLALLLSRQFHVASLERTALTDEATGLGNRQAFLAELNSEVAYSTRHSVGFVLGIIEIANIRFLNATVGYAGGNDAIVKLAQVLARTGRTEDRVYRLNGATFAVILRLPSDGAATDAAQGWRERLHSSMAQYVLGAPFTLDLRLSEVTCPTDARTTSDLLRLSLERLRPLTWERPAAQERTLYG